MKIEPSYRICKCLQSKNGGTKAPPYEYKIKSLAEAKLLYRNRSLSLEGCRRLMS